MAGLVQHIPAQYVYWVCSTLLSAVVFFVGVFVRAFLLRLESAQTQIADISNELTLQRTNCLTTLQTQGDKQISILERIADSVAYLKGKTDA